MKQVTKLTKKENKRWLLLTRHTASVQFVLRPRIHTKCEYNEARVVIMRVLRLNDASTCAK